MFYKVEWGINIEAHSPEEAARKAREIQLDPDSTATFYDVTYENGIKLKTINLKRKNYIVRFNSEFSLVVQARDEVEAIQMGQDTDIEKFYRADSEYEAEEGGQL